MTEKELIPIEEMLQANYQFLDFSNPALHGLWYEALKEYAEPDVRSGIKCYIRNESKTPTVHDVLEYVQPHSDQRRMELEHNLAIRDSGKVNCQKCNDAGYVVINYPTGLETVRPCDCEAGHRQFGPAAFKKIESSSDIVCAQFGGANAREAQLIASRYRRHTNDRRKQKGLPPVITYEEVAR